MAMTILYPIMHIGVENIRPDVTQKSKKKRQPIGLPLFFAHNALYAIEG